MDVAKEMDEVLKGEAAGQEQLATHMGVIASLFPEGSLLTLIVRPPGEVQADKIFLLSNDELPTIATTVVALIEGEAPKEVSPDA